MPRKKGEECQPWLNPRLHVWRNKVGDLTVINLRNADVDLGPVVVPVVAPVPAAKPVAEIEKKTTLPSSADPGRQKPATTATVPPVAADPCIVTAVKSVTPADSPPAEVDPVKTLLRQFMAKNEQSKKQTNATTPPATNGGTAALRSKNPVTALATAHEPTRRPVVEAQTPGTAGAPTPSSAPVTAAVASQAMPPDTVSKPVEFEFVSGTNIPGRGMVVHHNSPPATPTESPPPTGQGVALFHDPIWGDVDSSLFPPTTSTTTTGAQLHVGQSTLHQATPNFFDFGVLQSQQGLLSSSTAASLMGRLPAPTTTTSTAAFQAMPTGFTAGHAPQLSAGTMQPLGGLAGMPGMPITYIPGPTPGTMLPVQYIFGGDPTRSTHPSIMLQGALHTNAMPSQQQAHPLRVSAGAPLSSTPAAGGTSSAAGGARAGTNVEAQPFIPGGKSS